MHIAIRIARYAMTNSDKVKLVSLSNRTLMLIKDLMSNRDRINKSYQSIKVSIREMERVDKSTGKELVNISFLNYSLNFYNFFFS
jgi:succinate dehydrogenase/fumarate reductase-like Fe-S protein